MILYATNNTGSSVALAAANTPTTIPANSTLNITAEVQGLSGGQYALLEAQQITGALSFTWVGPPGYSTGSLSVANIPTVSVLSITALQNFPTTNLVTGAIVFVLQRQSWYQWVSDDTTTPDGQFVISGTNGRWFRLKISSPLTQKRVFPSFWYVDPVSGNDDNDGFTPGTAVATVRELNARFAGQSETGYRISILNNLTETDPAIFVTCSKKFGGVSITGQRTTLLTGTVTAATLHVPASNLAASLQDTGVASFTPYVGKFIEITSGPQTGYTASIAKDIGSNTARITRWVNALTVATTAPIAGSSYRIYDVTDVGTLAVSLVPDSNGATASFTDVKINYGGFSGPYSGSSYVGCIIAGGQFRSGGQHRFFKCIFSQGTTFSRGAIMDFTSTVLFLGSAGIGTDILACGMESPLLQGGGLSVSGSGPVSIITDLAVFDVTSGIACLSIFEGNCEIQLRTSFYGSGNTVPCVDIRHGGYLCIAPSAFTPTITTSHANQIIIDNQTSHIPPLVSGAVVPAIATMQTFAQWEASPFTRQCRRFDTGSAFGILHN